MEGAAHDAEAPALRGWLRPGGARLGDLLRSPEDRDEPLHAVVLLVARGDECLLAPPDDFCWPPTTSCCWPAGPSARRLLDTTLLVDAIREYVLHGRHVPSSWIWRAVTGRRA